MIEVKDFKTIEFINWDSDVQSLPGRLSLSLLQTCKQIYNETQQIFWSLNNFVFGTADFSRLSPRLRTPNFTDRRIREASLVVTFYGMDEIRSSEVEHFFEWCRERRLKKAVIMAEGDFIMGKVTILHFIKKLVQRWKNAANSFMDVPAVETMIKFRVMWRGNLRLDHIPEWVKGCKTMDELVRKFDNPDERTSTSQTAPTS
jgi:hypothetical protein